MTGCTEKAKQRSNKTLRSTRQQKQQREIKYIYIYMYIYSGGVNKRKEWGRKAVVFDNHKTLKANNCARCLPWLSMYLYNSLGLWKDKESGKKEEKGGKKKTGRERNSRAYLVQRVGSHQWILYWNTWGVEEVKKAPPFLLSNVTHTPGILRGRKRKINGRYACVCTCVGDAGAVDERSASIKRKKKKKRV